MEEVADGVARVSGLPEARLGELLRFEGGRMGYALSLDRDAINAAIFDEAEAIGVGTLVTATGEVARVPVGPGLLGRVVDPLGRPLDRDEPIAAEAFLPVERPAPAIIDRASGRAAGGHRRAGRRRPVRARARTARADHRRPRDRKNRDRGRRDHQPEALGHDLRLCRGRPALDRGRARGRGGQGDGPPERCVFVVASAASSAALQWIAPFAGFTIAEYFRDKGGHALIIVDDLTKHAATHRELALLTHEPPGREAFPGDIFYVHARLLERAAKLAPELGGGSLTALPIAETDAGNLSAFIPTNLISITDGQIVLDSRLFAANQRPAVDVGLSVSRVGGKAQRRRCAPRPAGSGSTIRSSSNSRCSPASAA